MSNENQKENLEKPNRSQTMTHPNPAVNPSLETDPLSPETRQTLREAIMAFARRIEGLPPLEIVVTALMTFLKDRGIPWGLLIDRPQSNLERDGQDLVRWLTTWAETLEAVAPRSHEGPVA